MSNMIEKFLWLLNTASAVSVDDGPMLTGITAEALTGDPDNQVVCFTWTDGEHDYMDILTEGGIAQGVFDSDGKFIADNYEGEQTEISFFAVERLNNLSGKQATALFFQELLDSVESLTGIAEEHKPSGVRERHYIRRPLDLLRMWHVKIEAWILKEAGVKLAAKKIKRHPISGIIAPHI